MSLKAKILIAGTALPLIIMAAFISANRETDPAEYLRSLGWEVAEPSSVKQVFIPEKFDAVYENYNNLQKSQGFDLSGYRAKTAVQYTFKLLNYSGDGEFFAHLLIYKGKVIGGDVCGYGIGGEIMPLTNN